jgi:hypothetical protein
MNKGKMDVEGIQHFNRGRIVSGFLRSAFWIDSSSFSKTSSLTQGEILLKQDTFGCFDKKIFSCRKVATFSLNKANFN